MGRTKTETAQSLLKLSKEIEELSLGLGEILRWFDCGEDPQVIAGALEHHPHFLAVLSMRAKALADDLSNQAAEEAATTAIARMRL